ncbi:hypothetical protein BFJ63_vAg8790 [Fusarium oxysporum f. sp. narcissi]|uniref:Zn(2)-C6 fungal-type domain-containing protein n=1 Tax=Fusarium oxysporum f. sp. narcissi TaxID=451672 RepID=A0A4Q2VPA1_FUSOX|nr:hypothetical protein FOWG_10049 [Fusarium oxysporum f. sp. lycopersici MN25]RKL20499.1 hypothetical protein BFJ70_g13666 [Fusarium oxysporum]RYC88392.1 hypothetical protein BFJ63_vAg8790 [Fusarium oxysporum f. sp. narcissi]
MRNRRACDACRQRKIQCDGDASSPTQQCNWCSCHGMICTFHGLRTKVVKSLPSLEFKDGQPGSSERAKNDPSSDGIGAKSELHSIPCHPRVVNWVAPKGSPTLYAGLLMGQNRCHTGIPFFTKGDEEWINSRTGGEANFQIFTALRMRQQTQLSDSPHIPAHGANGDLGVLPSRGITKAFLDAFHQSFLRLVFPVVDYTLFQETIAAAYEASDALSSPKQTAAKVCVLAFISMVGVLFHGRLSFLPAMDWDACYHAARSFLPNMLDEATLENLQTVLMLYLRQRYIGHSESSVILHSIACRMAFILGGNTYTETQAFRNEITNQERQTRHIRLLFWHCYIFDKDIALRTGQPPFISDMHCDLTLPKGYVETQFVLPLPGHHISSSYYADESLVPFLPGELRLSMLKHKTYELLYSTKALAKLDSEIIRAILELDDELESWRLSIPKVVRPALSVSDVKQALSELPIQHRMQNIVLHLEYHYLVVTIHRAGARCIADDSDTHPDADERYTAINSSIALCLEASRSTLCYLHAVIDDLAGEMFWVTVFYPTAAAMMLFLHVLAEPLAPQSKSDLELLSLAAGLIRSMPILRLTAREAGHVQLVTDFITELARLGNCAVNNAEKEAELSTSHIIRQPTDLKGGAVE